MTLVWTRAIFWSATITRNGERSLAGTVTDTGEDGPERYHAAACAAGTRVRSKHRTLAAAKAAVAKAVGA